MARRGFDPVHSGIFDQAQRDAELRNARLSGRWGQVAPESKGAFKASQLSQAKRQNRLSGQYFPNNVVQKAVERAQLGRQMFDQRNAAIRQGE
jgi:hypothetical protein